MRLKNKVAVITGAASGTGEEIAVIFARESAKVSPIHEAIPLRRRPEAGRPLMATTRKGSPPSDPKFNA